MRKLTAAIILSVLPMIASQAKATQIIASPTGIANPATTITFDEIVLPDFSLVTTQYAGLGASFAPAVYYSPISGFGNLQGHDVSNFDDKGNFVTPLTLNFGKTQFGVAFNMVGDATPFTFTALLNGVPVDSFTATVGLSDSDFYGFANETFNAISITQAGPGAPYYLMDNVQLLPTPEPSTLAFLGTGLIGLVGVAKRRLS
jgi:hypothetical protein